MMTTREFIQHVLMNCELDDPVKIEVKVPQNNDHMFLCFDPAHVTRIGNDDDCPETLIECKPLKEE